MCLLACSMYVCMFVQLFREDKRINCNLQSATLCLAKRAMYWSFRNDITRWKLSRRWELPRQVRKCVCFGWRWKLRIGGASTGEGTEHRQPNCQTTKITMKKGNYVCTRCRSL